ncbi:FAD-dependent monooxygenase [Rhodococcus wratislaviensis]|uniref:Putative phenol monooxygenase n=1 Tax=Rhodococcus wratislaviensis NBRC 100605 TaxID=1219028 RepID=X0PM41_RHOWR|nr:FAD-dependent monooxygenase [Rhodococcus wratislaviensis]GAF43589.1 putative phenol monooxygenase [Rhodococcus wratislaviensis NBRC 100605]
MPDHDTQVLVVGAGGCGLTLSIMLADLGVDHLIIERHATTSHLPKAHYLNSRTMEIFRQHGLADDVYAAGMPTHNATVRYITGLGGSGPLDRHELYTFDAFGGGALRERYEEAAAGVPTNFPQLRLEPLLRQHAEKRSAGSVRFGHELVSCIQDEDGVTAVVRDRARGEEYEVRAAYLVGADGGKIVGSQVGAVLDGPGPFANLKTMHVTMDLSEYIPGDALLTHVTRPGTRFWWVALVPMGPSWGPNCEEWGVAFAFRPDDQEPLADSDAPDAIREVLNLPDLEMTVHRGGEWLVERVVADRFRFGRIFLAGDAAHRHVPTGGLGLNSAVHDVHNLAWKLAAVVHGRCADPERLLQSYEDERRPADVANADWALFTFLNHQTTDLSLGISPGATLEENTAAVLSFVSDTPMGATLRARATEIMGTQRTEYEALEVELGFGYSSAAVVPDGTPAPHRDPMGCLYTPTTRPGHRLPHAWLTDPEGERLSTHDLVGNQGGFVLLTGRDGAAWRSAAAAAERAHGVRVEVCSIGDAETDLADPTGTWTSMCGICSDGAVLVRPDNIVGYRARTRPADPEAALHDAVRAILSAEH